MTKETLARTKIVETPASYIHDPVGRWCCVGCGYPLLQRILCELTDELSLAGSSIMVSGGGCHVAVGAGINIDRLFISHGRAPDEAIAIKRMRPDAFVYTVQGDGDVIAIGTESLIQAAARSDLITIIMANNGCYGNTGGQMAPTTMLSQVTSTTPEGRDGRLHGLPIRTSELVAGLDGTAYSARGAVNSPANVQRTKKYIRTAFQKQLDRVGFSFVEVLSMCPINWRLTPTDSLGFVDQATHDFPLGEYKNVDRVI